MNFADVKSMTIPVNGTGRDVKSISIGGVVVWAKPNPLPYTSKVEYLQFTGTQYIDTGLVPTFTTGTTRPICEVGGRMELAAFNANGALALFGSSLVTPRLAAIISNATTVRIGGGNGLRNTTIDPGISLNTPFTFRFRFPATGNRTFWLDGVQYDGGSGQPGPTGTPIYIIGSRRGPASSETYGTYLPQGKLYSAYIKDGTSYMLVRDFIPVRVETVGALYDQANPTGGPNGNGLYYNAGSGSFTLGPDVPA